MSHNSDPKEIRENLVRDAKRNLILDAARQVFAEKGFHDTKLEEIAIACGFSKASLYNYYEDKESLFLHLAIREHQRILDRLKERLNPSESFEHNLHQMLSLILTTLGEQFAFLLKSLKVNDTAALVARTIHPPVLRRAEPAAAAAAAPDDAEAGE